MVEELDCRPKRLLVKSHRSLPDGLRKILEEATGIRVLQYRGDCGKGDLVIYSPLTARPQGDCVSIRLPHLSLLVPLMREASKDWCVFLEDPEGYYYMFLYNEAERLYRKFEPGWRGEPILPRHSPPILVASEIYVHDLEKFRVELRRRAAEGANIIVVGADRRTNRREYEKAIKEASRDYTVFVDPMGIISPQEAYHYGAVGWMSLTLCELEAVDESVRGELAFVVIPRKLASAVDRFNELKSAYETGRDLGYRKLILDPVLQPVVSPGVIEGFYSALLLRKAGIGPVMLGVNNVYELLDADTGGSIALLVAMAAESGSSLVLVSEESVKSHGATIEAVVASRMASLAMYYDSPPKDFPFRLFLVKGKGRDLLV